MKCVDDFRLVLGGKEYVPIVIGGMGVDISTAELALEAARLGGIGHISDAMYVDVADRYLNTDYTGTKAQQYRKYIPIHDKSKVLFDLRIVEEATRRQVADVMERKRGDGLIFINCMEKLTMRLVSVMMICEPVETAETSASVPNCPTTSKSTAP